MLKRMIVVVAAVTTLMLAVTIPAFADWSQSCLGAEHSNCWWVLTDRGVQPVVPPTQHTYYPDQSVPDPDPCYYVQVSPQPDPGPAWHGHDPKHGRLWRTWCPDSLYIELHNPDGSSKQGAPRLIGTYYVPDGTPPGQDPGIDPLALAKQATGELTIPTPEPHFGPDADEVAVKIPVWLWIDYDGPIVKTASAGTLTATVTATLNSTTWQMGEPVDVQHPHSQFPQPVTCEGAGTQYGPGMDRMHPPCGYTYIWKSLPGRTNGTGTWTVTVTAHWTIRWNVSSGEAGSQQVTVTSTAPLKVREWHSVLVNQPG